MNFMKFIIRTAACVTAAFVCSCFIRWSIDPWPWETTRIFIVFSMGITIWDMERDKNNDHG